MDLKNKKCNYCSGYNSGKEILFPYKNGWICHFCYKRKVLELQAKNREKEISQQFESTTKEQDEIEPKKVEIEQPKIEMIYPTDIYNELNSYIIGQEEAKRYFASLIFLHFMRVKYGNNNDEYPKTNSIIYGPTGSGKTEMFRILKKYLEQYNIPVLIYDSSTLTPSGYKGPNTDNIISALYREAERNVEKTEHGIVYLDEFDKLISQRSSYNYELAIQHELLKLIEGEDIDISINNSNLRISTDNILFILGGSFKGLFKEEKVFSIGFNQEADKQKQKMIHDRFLDFGVVDELLGRCPISVGFNELGKEELKHIITNSENSVLKKYNNLLSKTNISIELSDDGIEEILRRVKENKIGARALNNIISEIIYKLIFTLDFNKAEETIIITKETIEESLDQ